MTILQALILGFIQGLAEFLPVSSSGHLVLAQHLMGIGDEQLTFDVFVHFGTLVSVLVIFRKDIERITMAMAHALFSSNWKDAYKQHEDVRLGVALGVSTLPAGIIGVLFHDAIKETFSDPKMVAMNLVITGLILFLTRLSKHSSSKRAGIGTGFLIGLAQAIAILPGISRSGTTISMALYLRVEPAKAAQFSFLMSIPVIAGAALVESRSLMFANLSSEILPLVIGTVTAAIMGYVAIKLLLKMLQRGKLSWFAGYCLVVGILGILFI